jgi:hypothetical protein
MPPRAKYVPRDGCGFWSRTPNSGGRLLATATVGSCYAGFQYRYSKICVHVRACRSARLNIWYRMQLSRINAGNVLCSEISVVNSAWSPGPSRRGGSTAALPTGHPPEWASTVLRSPRPASPVRRTNQDASQSFKRQSKVHKPICYCVIWSTTAAN